MCKCVCVSAARARASRVRLSGDCGCVSGREGPKTETESGPEMCSRRRLAPQNRSGPSKAAAKEMPPKKAKGGTAASGDAKSPKKKDSPSRKSSSRNSSRKVQDESVYLANATAPALPPSAPLPTTTESGPSVAELTRRVDELTRSMRAAGDREDYATALELQAERNALRVRLEELRLFGPVDADNFLERERRRVAAVLAVEAFEAAEADLEKAYGMDHARDPTILPYSMCSSNATRSAASYGVGPIEAVRATKPRAGAVPVASVPVARPRMAASEDEYYSVPVASGGWNERLNKLAGLAEDFSDTHATATPDLDELLRKMADGHLLTIAELEALERFQAEEEEEEEEPYSPPVPTPSAILGASSAAAGWSPTRGWGWGGLFAASPEAALADAKHKSAEEAKRADDGAKRRVEHQGAEEAKARKGTDETRKGVDETRKGTDETRKGADETRKVADEKRKEEDRKGQEAANAAKAKAAAETKAAEEAEKKRKAAAEAKLAEAAKKKAADDAMRAEEVAKRTAAEEAKARKAAEARAKAAAEAQVKAQQAALLRPSGMPNKEWYVTVLNMGRQAALDVSMVLPVPSNPSYRAPKSAR